MATARRRFTDSQIAAIQADRKAGLGWTATLKKHRLSTSTLSRIDKLNRKVSAAKTALRQASEPNYVNLSLRVERDLGKLISYLSAYSDEPQEQLVGRLLKEQIKTVIRKLAKE